MPDANPAETLAALRNPIAGMVFHEMHSYHIIIDSVDHGLVLWHDECSKVPQCVTIEHFVDRCVYGSDPNTPWVSLVVPEPPPIAAGI
jgi:hypothetical protein